MQLSMTMRVPAAQVRVGQGHCVTGAFRAALDTFKDERGEINHKNRQTRHASYIHGWEPIAGSAVAGGAISPLTHSLLNS